MFSLIRPFKFFFKEHINYVAKIIGPDHVGIGADYDGVKE